MFILSLGTSETRRQLKMAMKKGKGKTSITKVCYGRIIIITRGVVKHRGGGGGGFVIWLLENNYVNSAQRHAER
jgi:hypothetical protein